MEKKLGFSVAHSGNEPLNAGGGAWGLHIRGLLNCSPKKILGDSGIFERKVFSSESSGPPSDGGPGKKVLENPQYFDRLNGGNAVKATFQLTASVYPGGIEERPGDDRVLSRAQKVEELE